MLRELLEHLDALLAEIHPDHEDHFGFAQAVSAVHVWVEEKGLSLDGRFEKNEDPFVKLRG